MLPFFAKLSEKIKEKVYSLMVGPRDTKRKMEMDPFNRGPRAKKMKMSKSAEERDGDSRKIICFNNNQEENTASAASEEVNGRVASRGGGASNSSCQQEEEKAKTAPESDSPLKALLNIKKEHGRSSISRPRARNPYSVRKIHNLGSRRVVIWTEDQVEILNSALASFRYSPKTTTERVFIELFVSYRGSYRGVCGFNREDVANWLSQRCDYDCSQRLLSRKRKIEEVGEIEVCENKKTRRIRFSEEIQQKYFSIFENPSAVEENHNVVYVPLKE